jgi:hypothetical protein
MIGCLKATNASRIRFLDVVSSQADRFEMQAPPRTQRWMSLSIMKNIVVKIDVLPVGMKLLFFLFHG